MTKNTKAARHISAARRMRSEAARVARWGMVGYADQLKRAARIEMDKAHSAMGFAL